MFDYKISKHPHFDEACRAFRPIMHLHENHYTKRAGVAGLRARGSCNNYVHFLNYSCCGSVFGQDGSVFRFFGSNVADI